MPNFLSFERIVDSPRKAQNVGQSPLFDYYSNSARQYYRANNYSITLRPHGTVQLLKCALVPTGCLLRNTAVCVSTTDLLPIERIESNLPQMLAYGINGKSQKSQKGE